MTYLRSTLLFVITLTFLTGMSFGQKKPKASPKPSPERTVTQAGTEDAPPPSKGLEDLPLTRVDSITESLSAKRYFYQKEEGFRIQMPVNFSEYIASEPASDGVESKEGQVVWTVVEADLVILFGDLGAKTIGIFTREQKLRILSESLSAVTKEKDTTVISERDLTVNGLPAKEVRYKQGDQEYLARDLFVGSRLFVFVAGLRKVDNAETIVKHALDSFEPLKKE